MSADEIDEKRAAAYDKEVDALIDDLKQQTTSFEEIAEVRTVFVSCEGRFGDVHFEVGFDDENGVFVITAGAPPAVARKIINYLQTLGHVPGSTAVTPRHLS